MTTDMLSKMANSHIICWKKISFLPMELISCQNPNVNSKFLNSILNIPVEILVKGFWLISVCIAIATSKNISKH